MGWEKVCCTKIHGGLGVNDRFVQYGFIGKWKWELFHNEGSLWGRVLGSKYEGLLIERVGKSWELGLPYKVVPGVCSLTCCFLRI